MRRETVEKAPATLAASPPRPVERRGVQTFRSLRHRDFRLLWCGILGTSAGQWIEQVSVAWVVLQMTDSPAMVGIVQGARALPALVLSPIGGIIADRFDRRNVLLLSQLSAAVLAAAMATLSLTGVLEVWHIFCLVLGFGIMWALNNPVRHSFIPHLVPRGDLMNAVALNSLGFNISRSAGPFLGAALLGGLGFGKTYAITAAFYILVLLFTVQIRTRSGPAAAARETLLESLHEGVRYLKGDRIILALIIMALLPVAVGMPFIALVPVFARDVLGKDELGFGLMMGFSGFGSLVSTLLLASFQSYRRGGLMLMGLALLFSASLVVFGLSKSYGLSLAALFVAGGASMMYLSLSNTLIQLLVDDAVRGRVMSLLMMEFGLTPLGAMVAGAYAEAVSPQAAVVTMGLLLAGSITVAALVFKDIRRLDLAHPRTP